MNIILIKCDYEWWYYCGPNRRYKDRDLATRFRHSHATSVAMELKRNMPDAKIEIHDTDGLGFVEVVA